MARASSPLPVPLSPVMSTVASRRRDLPRDAVDLLHRRARADEPLQPIAVALAELPAQVLRLDAELAPLERALERDGERVEVDGFVR